MRVIYSGRCSGRTTELIRLAADAEKRGEVSYIVCHNHAEAYRIARQAYKSEQQIGFPITYDELLFGQFAANNIAHFFIDNVDMLIRQISRGIDVAAITLEAEVGT